MYKKRIKLKKKQKNKKQTKEEDAKKNNFFMEVNPQKKISDNNLNVIYLFINNKRKTINGNNV